MDQRQNRPYPPRRAVIATADGPVREYLAVLLEDRGFTVEAAHRAEYLEVVAPGAELVVADLGMLVDAMIAGKAHEILALSTDEPIPGCAEALGASSCFQIPFADAPQLASLLDSVAARTVERDQTTIEPWLEPALAG